MNRVLIAGDLFPSKKNEELFLEGDIKALFGDTIIELFQNADISVCNLEGALTTSDEKTVKLGPSLKAHPGVLVSYEKLGINLFATANNHINDYSQIGYDETKRALSSRGLMSIGSGSNISDIVKYKRYELSDGSVCIYNVAETMFNIPTASSAGVNLYDEYVVCKEIEQLKKENDIVVVIYHGGVEYFQYPTLELKKRFHRMADSGADVILAQHTHCIGCEEVYNQSYLLYGQGNFLFDRSSVSARTKEGLVIELIIEGNKIEKITKHLVTADNGTLKYIKDPDFREFYERGSHIADDVYIESLFKDFVMTQRHVKTQQFVVKRFYDNFLKLILSKKRYKEYKKVKFTKPQLMRFLYTLRSEQQRETALYLVLKELEEYHVKL